MNGEIGTKRWPLHGWLGAWLLAVAWTLNWSMSGLRTHLLFFFLWLGYCLTVDALVYYRKGTSLLTRSPLDYLLLFLISAPAWWLFELINWRTGNWFYNGRECLTDLQYVLMASLSFSTVMPAVFGTAEAAGTFGWLRRMGPGLPIAPGRGTTLFLFALGWLMLAALLIWPLYFFPFVWLSVFFILEPLNVWLGNPVLLNDTGRGDWRPLFALWTGCLICGFFWEMWNFYSYPKWFYRVPFVDFFRIFEMPILGYGGYIPFSLELFALYHFILGLFKRDRARDFLQF
jgi:hypothetical protein